MSRWVKVVVLCEGIKDWDFARHALLALGVQKRELSPQYATLADGGSGEQFVREQYPVEVREQRLRPRSVLLVSVDADTGTVVQRSEQLARALASSGQKSRDRRDKVSHWIPKRNIETWVHLYVRGPINEQTDYSKYKFGLDEADTVSAARAFGADLRRKSISPRKCPSLAAAVQETERIRPLGRIRSGRRGR